MRALRPPLVAGLGPGLGTSTVAAGLHARDGGRWHGVADIVVCGDAGDALRCAGELAAMPATTRPVLAVACTADAVAPPAARLRALQRSAGAVVLLPHVPWWHGLAAPFDEAAAVLGQPAAQLPRPLQDYAAALRRLAAAVLRSGQLERPTPPAMATGYRGLRPVERCVGGTPRPVPLAAAHPARPVPVATCSPPRGLRAGIPPVAPVRPPSIEPEPDDDALEAAGVLAAAVAGRAR